jgi:1-acyl-sn-glycerol-3-phosphate acyltransferase
MKWLAGFILKIFGWKVTSGVPEGISKAVVVMAPHTSNWDFVIGRLAFASQGVRISLMIKKESFFFPLGPILKALGGIPVDRRHSQNTVKTITKHFEESEKFFLIITPEGTRKRVDRWKKGFYFIAENAKVPILLGYLDYRKKEGGIGPTIIPGGDFDRDFARIQDFYRDKHACHPEKFSLTGTSPGQRDLADKPEHASGPE